jgi:hypothetical protein
LSRKSFEEAQALCDALADRLAACKLALSQKTKTSIARMQTGTGIT